MRSEAEILLSACQAGVQKPPPEPTSQSRMPTIPGAIPEEAVAALFGLTVRTLREKCRKGERPTYIRPSRSTTVYLAADVKRNCPNQKVPAVT